MRFILYDRITSLVPGESITGVKTFSLTEEFLRNHYGKKPLVPGVMYIEAMAQLLGWLIVYTHDFRSHGILTLIEDVTLAPALQPGFSAEISARLISSSDTDSLGTVRMTVDGREIASIGRIIYVHKQIVSTEQMRQLFRYYGGWPQSQEG
ncbi:MAG: beta-hydroxyacyl-ACP dehydratase [Syntrophobacteraceae bacterium]